MKKNYKYIFLYISVFILLFSCKKKEPETFRPDNPVPEIKRNMAVTLRTEDGFTTGIPVRWHKPYNPVSFEEYLLIIDGLVDKPGRFSIGDIVTFPTRSVNCRMKSADGWSIRKTWEGIHFSDLCKYLKVRKEAKYVHFYCADGYEECVELTDLLGPRVILGVYLEECLILAKEGGPVILVLPHKYSYKWAKAITRITFSDKKITGTKSKENKEKYPEDGDIRPGQDSPIDLKGEREIYGGEITEY